MHFNCVCALRLFKTSLPLYIHTQNSLTVGIKYRKYWHTQTTKKGMNVTQMACLAKNWKISCVSLFEFQLIFANKKASKRSSVQIRKLYGLATFTTIKQTDIVKCFSLNCCFFLFWLADEFEKDRHRSEEEKVQKTDLEC